jgi:hypothetical protein
MKRLHGIAGYHVRRISPVHISSMNTVVSFTLLASTLFVAQVATHFSPHLIQSIEKNAAIRFADNLDTPQWIVFLLQSDTINHKSKHHE